MNFNGTQHNRGLAVVMALALILLLATVSLELHINERTNLLNSAAMRDRLNLNQMTVSGIHLAMAVLIKDRLDSEADSLQEDWADEENLDGLLAEIPFDQGRLSVKIIDELGKVQINALVQFPEGRQFNVNQRNLWERFTDQFLSLYKLLDDSEAGLIDTDPLTIINSIKDWLDSGDDDAITGLSGAESDYYEELDPPYACKNGPFDHLSEVSLVQGVTPEIFNGLGGAAGLADYITVYGAMETPDHKFSFPGKININTAELAVLSALLPSDDTDFAQLLIDYREAISGTQYTNDLTNINWYKNVPGFAGISIEPDLITVSSNIFRIVAKAELGDVHTTTTAVVRREKDLETKPWQCKILNWWAE